MLIIGLDTALQRCSVAILRNGERLTALSEELMRGHAELLAPMVQQALAEAVVEAQDIDCVGVTIGPGGFTGVRVGLAFARGLAIGSGIGVRGVSTLAALAAGVDAKQGLVAAVIDARREQVYAGLYNSIGVAVVSPFVATPSDARDMMVSQAKRGPVQLVGSGAALLSRVPSNWDRLDAKDQIDANIVASLAAASPAPAAPLYLRNADAKPPKPSKFERPGARPSH